MTHFPLLNDLLVIYGIGVVVVLLSYRLRQSAIVGYLLTGIVIGPFGFGLVPNASEVDRLAEIGVMMLLFSLGLEFSLKKLFRMRRVVLGTGSAQVLACILGTFLLCWMLDVEWPQNLFWGYVISLSSTAIVVKHLIDQAEVDSVHGRISLGLLIFQDLAIVPMMVSLPLLRSAESLALPLIVALTKAGLVTLGTILTARYLFPRILYNIVRTRNKELFVIASIFMFLGTAWTVSMFGLSLAIGAFLAGLVLSESEYSHEIFAEIRPLRDSLNSLFFISVGMLVDPAYVLPHFQLVGTLVLIVLLGKAILVSGIVFLSRYPVRIALLVGMGLAQIGEFSFVLLREGLKYELLSDHWYQALLATSVGSMLLTPLIFKISMPLAAKASTQRWARRLQWKAGLKDISEKSRQLHDHVIICGYGTSGINLAKVLRKNAIPYVVLELNIERVREGQASGEKIYFGDATQVDVLRHAAIESARALVLAISDPFAIRGAVRIARSSNPHLFIMVRTKYLIEIQDLFELGASEVVTEEFETSIELLTRILRVYSIPSNVIREEVKIIRDERYTMFRDLHLPASYPPEWAADLKIQTESFLIKPSTLAVGRTIQELGLRTKTGTSIIAVVRHGSGVANPSPDFLLESGDVLTLLGSSEQIDSALEYLESHDPR